MSNPFFEKPILNSPYGYLVRPIPTGSHLVEFGQTSHRLHAEVDQHVLGDPLAPLEPVPASPCLQGVNHLTMPRDMVYDGPPALHTPWAATLLVGVA